MATISHAGLNRTVPNLAARDAISPKVQGLTVTVVDSTGDPVAGSGVATYTWINDKLNWMLTGDDDDISFTLADKQKLNNIGTIDDFNSALL